MDKSDELYNEIIGEVRKKLLGSITCIKESKLDLWQINPL